MIIKGPSGVSKTISTELACILSKAKRPIIEFNITSETTPADLLGKIISDKNSLALISPQEGVFLKAFKYGHPLLLEGINLASKEVLQCLEEALDTEIISIETQGFPLTVIKKHPDFSLIATQTINIDSLDNKTTNLDKKFISRFHVMTFHEFGEEELYEIAIGLSKNFNFKVDKKIIEDLVKFHKKLSNSEDFKGYFHYFTLREISDSIKAFSEGNNIFDSIMTIYGSGYQKSLKQKLEKLLRSYDSFVNIKPNEISFPVNFPKCFKNNSILEAFKSIQFCFENKRNVIITGKEGSGKTQVSLWFAEWYSKERNIKKENIFYCLCTEELKCSDLIGKLSPNYNYEQEGELMEWKNGFLLDAMENGGIVILDSLDQASAGVIERLSSLLDQKEDNMEIMKFNLPENNQKPEIIIHSNFRLICISDSFGTNKIPPSFINRLIVIYLEDQMEPIIEKKEKKKLIEFLLINSYNENRIKKIISEFEHKKEEEEEINFEDYLDIDFNLVEDDQNIINEEEYNEFGGDNEDFNFNHEDDEKIDNKSNEKSQSRINSHNKEFNESDNSKRENNEIEEEIKNEYIPTEELINLVYNKSHNFKTIYDLNKFCRTIRIFIIYFKDKENITLSSIVDFCYFILAKEFKLGDLIEIPSEIEKHLLDLRVEPDSDESKYLYKNSKLLSNYFAILNACRIANIHLNILGPTGIGKTSSIKAFGRIISKDPTKRFDFEIHSFNKDTKPNHFYGKTTINDGRIVFKYGTLTNAVLNGYIFIADELNLSSMSNMSSLAPVLEMNLGTSINLPGIDESITIHPNFFFVIEQNEVNPLPHNISKRLKTIYYPLLTIKDVPQICREINDSLYSIDENKIINTEQAEKLGEYMVKLNSLNLGEIPQWTLRDVKKLFQRQIYQNKIPDYFRGITFCHNLLFYTMSSLKKEDILKVEEKVINLIQEVFDLSYEERNNIKECFDSEVELKNDSYGFLYLYKGSCSISFEIAKNYFITSDIENPIIKLKSLLEGLFQILLASNNELILLIGPSGYKTYLSQKLLSNSKIIAPNKIISLEQFLGAPSLLYEFEAKELYLRLISLICGINDYNNLYKNS